MMMRTSAIGRRQGPVNPVARVVALWRDMEDVQKITCAPSKWLHRKKCVISKDKTDVFNGCAFYMCLLYIPVVTGLA